MKTKTILIIGGVVVGGGIAWYLYNRNKNQVVQTNEDFTQTEQAIVAIENKILNESKAEEQEKLYQARLAELISKEKLCNSGWETGKKLCREAAAKKARKEFPKLAGLSGTPYLMT